MLVRRVLFFDLLPIDGFSPQKLEQKIWTFRGNFCKLTILESCRPKDSLARDLLAKKLAHLLEELWAL